ncbi:MAG: hypothetical protein WAW54_06295, partial [Parvibaculum sedimenti]|uniref:hypothetical protein n=1 Tax=Parvibaculum sedimenti TaxID=2608632 RepID=UPI003BB5B990
MEIAVAIKEMVHCQTDIGIQRPCLIGLVSVFPHPRFGKKLSAFVICLPTQKLPHAVLEVFESTGSGGVDVIGASAWAAYSSDHVIFSSLEWRSPPLELLNDPAICPLQKKFIHMGPIFDDLPCDCVPLTTFQYAMKILGHDQVLLPLMGPRRLPCASPD